jgi:transposase
VPHNQRALRANLFAGHVFIFRAKRASPIKILFYNRTDYYLPQIYLTD